MNNILDKLKKKYPALQEEPLMDDLASELSSEEDLGPSEDHMDEAEDLGQEQDSLDEPPSEEAQDEDMGFLAEKPAAKKKKIPLFKK